VPVTCVWLARHGQSIWNRDKRITGQLDPPLSPMGERQAEGLAHCLAEVPLEAIVASTLQRSLRTAQVVAAGRGLAVEALSALREIHFGELQGRPRDGRDPEAERAWAAREQDKRAFRPAGGESYAELTGRVLPCLAELLTRHKGGSILIVGHRNTNRALLQGLMGWSPGVAVTVRVRSDCCYMITLGTGAPRLETRRFGEAEVLQ
jgi:broad specificity phosphatase PhoE